MRLAAGQVALNRLTRLERIGLWLFLRDGDRLKI
jgi:hypothetical protein